MRVLVACEESQVVTSLFRMIGHEAYSCDTQPCGGDNPEWHIQGDVLPLLDDGWDMMIAHPPCTYLCITGNKWMKPEYADRFPNRPQQREEAIKFFMALYNAPIKKIAVENPVGIMSTVFRKPDQYIQPYFFRDPASKKTGLWLKGLPLLAYTTMVEPEMCTYSDGRKDPLWHFESLKLPPNERTKIRSRTFEGFAGAMAVQWGIA